MQLVGERGHTPTPSRPNSTTWRWARPYWSSSGDARRSGSSWRQPPGRSQRRPGRSWPAFEPTGRSCHRSACRWPAGSPPTTWRLRRWSCGPCCRPDCLNGWSWSRNWCRPAARPSGRRSPSPRPPKPMPPSSTCSASSSAVRVPSVSWLGPTVAPACCAVSGRSKTSGRSRWNGLWSGLARGRATSAGSCCDRPAERRRRRSPAAAIPPAAHSARARPRPSTSWPPTLPPSCPRRTSPGGTDRRRSQGWSGVTS